MDVTSRARGTVSATTRVVERAVGMHGGRFSTALQLPFSIIYCVLALSCLAIVPDQVRALVLALCLAVCVAMTVLARVVDGRVVGGKEPWAPLPAVLCAVDFALVFGLQRSIGFDGALVLGLAILPAVWLAYVFLWPGAVAGVVAMTVVVGLTAWIDPATGTLYLWVSIGALPLSTLTMAAACVIITEHWEEQRSQLRAEQQRLDTALVESTTTTVLLETIITSFDSAIVAFDTSGEILMSNAPQSRIWGLTWDGEIGASDRLVFGEDRRTPLTPERYPSTRAAAGLTSPDMVMWVGAYGPQQRAVNVSTRRMDDSSGRHLGVMVIYHDITDMMSALRAKDEFVATVSHELRTPLTSIMGYRELIVDDHTDGTTPLSDETLSYLEIMGRNADHLLARVADLLTVAQASAGSLDLTMVECHVDRLVERAVESAQPRFISSGVGLRATVRPTPALRADESRLTQVVDNLLSNAVKYTPRGGSVEVSTFSDSRSVGLTITDSGVGMSPDDLDLAFSTFHRAPSARSSQIPGIGLGLPISRTIVEAHGGSITLTSAPGRGTTVRVSLPRETASTELGDRTRTARAPSPRI